MAERADAARNRQAVLDAAGRLFDDAADPGSISMDDVARAAGVGKGTLFRRFGDRVTLLRAVYDARLAGLRTAIDSGPPPLGPDGAAAERIPAVLDALIDFKLDNRRLAAALEQGAPALYTSPSYVGTHQLLSSLLAQVIDPDDADWTAYALLATTRVDLVDHLANEFTREELRAQLGRFVARVLAR